MKIAITSVNGQLGTAIANKLIQDLGKDNVIGIARTPEKAKHLGIEIRQGDYNNRQHFVEALKGIDKLVLISGMDEPQKRIQQHRNVIEAAKLNGVQKIVYTSIVGDEKNTAFSPVLQSNRQTEEDIKSSGLQYTIGRNGIYIEPDLEYIATYIKEGGISNCAAEGKCTYTSRKELGYAYAKMLLNDHLNVQTLNLVGDAITQAQLAGFINQVYGTSLTFTSIGVEDYKKERQAALGDFIGSIIAGIYEGIKNGANDVASDYEKATGRKHQTTLKMITEFHQKQNI